MTTNYPIIRFKGFTDDWEQRKLGDVIILFGGNAFKSSDSKEEGTRWLKIANVGLDKIDWNISSYLPEEYWEIHKAYQLKRNDYVMALTRPILNGRLKIAKIDLECLLNQRVAKLNFSTDYEFGYQLLKKSSTVSLIENELAGTDPPNLSSKNLENIDVKIASCIHEQTKIGNFFKQLDNTIALHQRKLELLKEQKKGFLQQMFPKNDEKVPKIRFKGFTDDWEQRKLGEITSYIKGFAFKSKDYTDRGTRIIRVSDLSKDKIKELNDNVYVSELIAKENKKFVIEKDDIIITTVGSKAEMKESAVGRPIIVRENNNYLLNQNLVKVRNSECSFSYFIYCQLIKSRYSDYIATVERGNANQANIAINDLWEYSFLSPKKDEQTKIGNFFKQLDDTIALHQQQLDKLKETKKGLLQKMFV